MASFYIHSLIITVAHHLMKRLDKDDNKKRHKVNHISRFMVHLLIFENILKNNYLINFNKKSEMPITVNPFESNDSSSGLLITIIF